MRISNKTEPVSGYIPECYCDEDGNCTRCGECCTTPILHLTETDKKRIHAYIKKHGIARQDHSALNTEADTNTVDLLCPFLRLNGINENGLAKDANCTIYDARPEICRLYKCSMNTLQDEIDEAKPSDEFIETMGRPDINHGRTNLCHEFFPETRVQQRDFVIINAGIHKLHDEFLGQAFLVLRVHDNLAEIARLGPDDFTGFLQNVPVFTLTKIE